PAPAPAYALLLRRLEEMEARLAQVDGRGRRASSPGGVPGRLAPVSGQAASARRDRSTNGTARTETARRTEAAPPAPAPADPGEAQGLRDERDRLWGEAQHLRAQLEDQANDAA